MTDEQIAKVPGGVQLLPMTGGRDRARLQPARQPQGLKLPRDVYAGIFLGKITKWSDPKLKAANPGVTLPDLDITVVRRADSSGTTFVFTTHLSAISEEWKQGPGGGDHGELAEERQVRGLAQERRRHRDHQADAGRHRLHRVRVRQVRQGRDGASCRTRPASSWPPVARAARRRWPACSCRPTCARGSPIPEGPKSYPIATYTWMLFYKENKDPKKAAALRAMVEYCLTDGQKVSAAMGYIPLPETVVAAVRKASASIQ